MVLRIKKGIDAVPAENVWRMTVRLMSGKYRTEESLIKGLTDLGFHHEYMRGGLYKTKTELARFEKEKQNVEDQVVAQLISDYRQRFLDICVNHSQHDVNRGPGAVAMREVYLEVINRSGTMLPDFRVERGYPNLSD